MVCKPECQVENRNKRGPWKDKGVLDSPVDVAQPMTGIVFLAPNPTDCIPKESKSPRKIDFAIFVRNSCVEIKHI